MKEIVPSYYKKFRCIAGDCRHSCCIGWEIDIDEDTLSLYDNPAVSLYNRLQKSIERTETPHFCLDREERCPFLNEKGLCDIILTMGEECLCQICNDHPRFRSFFSDHTETGLGLCCEAAAALILQEEEPTVLQILQDDGEKTELSQEESDFLEYRDKILFILQNREYPLGRRISDMLAEYSRTFPVKTTAQWAEIYRTLEQLDPTWNIILDKMASSEIPVILPDVRTPWENTLENLAVYFIFRHLAGTLDDDRLAERSIFSAVSTAILYTLFLLTEQEKGCLTTEDMVELSRLYSSEIEYSEENMETLLELFSKA